MPPARLKGNARALLGRALGFCRCPPATLDRIVAVGTIKPFARGDVLVHRNTIFDALFVVVEGSLEASVSHADGRRQLIGLLLSGDVTGFANFIDGQGYANDLIARSNSTSVLTIPGQALRDIKAQDSKVGEAIELQLAARSRMMNAFFIGGAGLPPEARLARLIISLARMHGQQTTAGMRLATKISQVDLADWLGVSRHTINAGLHYLKAQGLIQQAYSTITVTDTAGLLTVAHL
jgi:CRP-like cAMP-binding protein